PLASYGLYYQWGRKDPFPSANATTINNVSGVTGSAAMYGTEKKVTITSGPVSMAIAIANPTTFYEYGTSSVYDWNSSPNVNLWGNPTTSIVNSKSPYDPCPVGWRVPVYKSGVSPWNGLSGSWSSKVGYSPASGYRHCNNGEFYNVGSSGNCWAAAPNGNYGCYLYFYSSHVTSSYKSSRAAGFGVRCCRE
ncbi:MAG: fibrobacter succinogenes major paralogous domain-containing protein, partial [Bacteroidaceae bacterium]|nr:fibrobacter succinogenes major paralogous domain-containing protein [Bacteroidaceae bacterium]